MEIKTMSIVRHRYPAKESTPARADRVTLWLLVVVVVAAFMALTFGDAGGATLL
jgi:hypothetical protein